MIIKKVALTAGTEYENLTHFWPIFLFYTHSKHQKTIGLLVLSGDIKWEHWPKMG